MKNKNHLTKEKVKEYLWKERASLPLIRMKNKNSLNKKEVTRSLWREFEKFINGQTVGIGKNGQYLYYKWDVDNFLTNPEKRFFD